MDESGIGTAIIESALKVHSTLGAGLLESAYEACLAHELEQRNLEVRRQVPFPVEYCGMKLDIGYRLDMLVGNAVVVEIKATDKVLPVHASQVLSYLRLGGYKLGYLLNFNVVHMKDGIKRIINGKI